MPGSAGSKYGIIEDEIPVRVPKKILDATIAYRRNEINNLKDLRLIVRRSLQKKNNIQIKLK